jgi:anthranilate synthase component 2
MILLLDNFDSFTWNIFHYAEMFSKDEIEIRRNNEISIEEIGKYKSIILSPGPGLPKEAGIMPELLRVYSKKLPILGICLGHQAIAESFGASLKNLDKVWHGVQKQLLVTDPNDRLFKDIPQSFSSGHYHSWVIQKETLPSEFNITATDEDGTIMAISHQHLPLSGVQFHPESIMTSHGLQIIKNWLTWCGHV